MRRDGGCDKRDSRSVEGRQGHEPGGTIDADDMRPQIEMHSSDKQDGCHSLRGQTTCFWLRAFLLGADRPGESRVVGGLPGLESGDMPTRRTGRTDCRAEGIAIRTTWLTGRHLAASLGRNAECVFRVSRTARLGFRRGPKGGGWVTLMDHESA